MPGKSIPRGLSARVLTGASLGMFVFARVLFGGDASAQEAKPIVIRDVRVVVGEGTVIETTSVGIRQGRFVLIGEKVASDADATTIDGSGLTIIPGLIDSHVHMFAGNRGAGKTAHETELREDVPGKLAAYLRAGVTTIKSTGDPTSLILQLRDELRTTPSSGPRLLVTGPGITTRDGWPTPITGTDRWWRSEHCREITTPAEAVETVRTLAAQGVDAIKLHHHGGPLAPNGDVYPKLPLGVLTAAIEEAHRQGLRATVHTWTSADALRAIQAGADGLEHGVVADEASMDLFQLMAEKHAFYVPTMSVYRFVERDQRLGLRNLAAAREAKVRFALGSDTFTSLPTIDPPLGANTWTELEWMAKSGMTNAEVIQAATRDAAEHLGILDQVGTIEVGKWADMVLLAVDPLKQLPKLDDIVLVVRAGHIVHNARQDAATVP